MSNIPGEKAKQEELDRMAVAAMQARSADDEKKLRQLLSVPDKASLQDILQLIAAEGWEPLLFRQDFEGVTLWACPIRKDIWTTFHVDEATGQKGHKGSINPTIAALHGLRNARGLAEPK